MKKCVLIFLLLAGCTGNHSELCGPQSNKKWLSHEVTYPKELDQEIDELLLDQQCTGITPAMLRKVLHDIVRNTR